MLWPPRLPWGKSLFSDWLIATVRMNNRILTTAKFGWEFWKGALEVPASSICRAQKHNWRERESQLHSRTIMLHGHLHSRQGVSVSNLKPWFKVVWNHRKYSVEVAGRTWQSLILEVSHMLPFIWHEIPLNKVWQEAGDGGGLWSKLLSERWG